MSMAEEAFALSPLSASAASPTDADYHAIREAFMETARGRWFLNEYAKRNRNADTAMVLEAVARIEQSIGAQSEAAAPPPAPEVMSEAALAALESARAAIRAEFSETGFDHTLLPWRKSSRIIREITWGLRESGADPRICNILDGQARAIEAACDEFPLAVIRDRVLASLDAVLPQDLEAAPAMTESVNDEPVAAAEIMADAAPVPAPILETQPEAVVAETAVTEAPVVEAPIMEAAVAEAITAKIEAAMEVIAPASPETTSPETPVLEAASLEDVASEVEALLEAAAEAPPAPIAAVAEAPQPAPVAPAPRSIMTASASQPAPQPVAQSVPVEASVAATAASLPHVAPATEPAPESTMAAEANGSGSDDLWADIEAEIAPLPPFDPAHEASLGASLIEQGVVARPANGRADLLAPIRRMSHAERIAFFS
jgi:hypothetical protein